MIRVVAKRTSMTQPQTCEYTVLISLTSLHKHTYINKCSRMVKFAARDNLTCSEAVAVA